MEHGGCVPLHVPVVAAVAIQHTVTQAVLKHLEDGVVLDEAGAHRGRADEPAKGRLGVVVQAVEEDCGKPPSV